MKNNYRVGVLQVPVIKGGFPSSSKKLGRSTGIRCPRCQKFEIVYNGNYFCADRNDCNWALPHGDIDPKYPEYDEPKPLWNLVDALIESMTT